MSSRAKTLIATALSWSGGSAWLGRRPRSAPLILGYHRVVADAAEVSADTLPGMAISKATLRAHLEWLGRHFRVASLDEIGDRLARGLPCGDLAAITFDDGYRSVYDHALPILRELRMPSAVFVITGLLRTGAPPPHDQLYQLVLEVLAGKRALPPSVASVLQPCQDELTRGPIGALHVVRALLARPNFDVRRFLHELAASGERLSPTEAELDTVDWSTLAALRQAGVIIGSHTCTHAFLDHEDDETVRREVERSRIDLEQGLGITVRHFAYPDGRFSPRVVRAVEDAGYRYGYTICDHSREDSPLLTIPRVMLWEGSCQTASGRFSPSLMQCHAASVLPFPQPCHHDHEANAERPC
jgi:peptidoglycan/xylan/chitin deacetylase (PgdA/CDA1 family)